jgi:asparagine synthase (glutamine-hydrolysing)
MCAIFSYYSKSQISIDKLDSITNSFQRLRQRWPDASSLQQITQYVILWFHRLALMDLSEDGMQPFVLECSDGIVYVTCNGEIYNAHQIIQQHHFHTVSSSDCEVIGHLFVQGGIEHVLASLHGEFACTITQVFADGSYKYYVFRDPIGVRPLFVGVLEDGWRIYASELKAIYDLSDEIQQYIPGHYSVYDSHTDILSEYTYFDYDCLQPSWWLQSYDHILSTIRTTLAHAVQDRLQSDRSLCCLLSWWLDSSLIAALAQYYSLESIDTFTIGMDGWTDLPFAQMVADHIWSRHHVIELTVEQWLQAIDQTIYAIESYDITTVRASVWQYLIAEYISQCTEHKAILCGELSDELCSGYKYFHSAPSCEAMHKENIRLIQDVHLYDGLRTDRTMAYHGLEVRLPFADTKFVTLMCSIDPQLRMPQGWIEKYLLRNAFAETTLLPQEVLWRSKEAFSDGVSSVKKSWYEQIQDYIDTIISDEEFMRDRQKFTHCPPTTKESYYYRKKFVQYFWDKHAWVIPYYWMPRRSWDIQDPSARILSVYTE